MGAHGQVHVHANMGGQALILFTRVKPYFNIDALIFYGWRIKPTHSQPTKHAKNYDIHIFDYEGQSQNYHIKRLSRKQLNILVDKMIRN